jgi:putative PIN family toxin of toxin-antitoxin system
VVLSEFILEELSRKLCSKFHQPPEEVDAHLLLLRLECDLVQPAQVGRDACRDPNDLPVLGTMLAARPDFLVTGDKDLLALAEFNGRPILSPRQMLSHLLDRDASP